LSSLSGLDGLTFRLSAFEWVAVLRLDGGSDSAAQGDGVNGSALAETLEHSHLRGEHVSFVNRGDGALGFVVDAFCGIGDEDAGGVNHRL
jgi:hypothetical protein